MTLIRAVPLVAALFLCPSWQPAPCAAEPEAAGGAVPCSPDSTREMPAPVAPADRATAAAQISGSPWPGVIDHLLQRPQPGENDVSTPAIHINYPSLGRPAIDADIRAWVSGLADAFTSHLDLSALAGAEAGPPPGFELWGSYEVSWPSPNAVSITFELWNYAGGPVPNLDIMTLNYSLITDARLGLVDMFEDPEKAIELMSLHAGTELEKRLGALSHNMADGILPLPENYSSLTLDPLGLRINFQPYQAAPWAAGPQYVDMPLSSLLPAGPYLPLWGR